MVEAFGLSLPVVLTAAGIALLVAEALAPGGHLVVVGVALLVAGIVGMLLGPAATPLVLAGAVLGAGGVAFWAYRHFDFYGGKGAGRTQDSDSLVGKQGQVVERVTPTSGRIRLADGGFDPVYSARSVAGEIPEGTTVVVTDPGGGSVVTVESIEYTEDDPIDRELARERERSAADHDADAEHEAESERE